MPYRLTAQLRSIFNTSDVRMFNGAIGATTSMYMSLCVHVRERRGGMFCGRGGTRELRWGIVIDISKIYDV